MKTNFTDTARNISNKLVQLELAWEQFTVTSFSTLESTDPELTKLALQVLEDRQTAANWLAAKDVSLEWKSPWRSIVDGERERVIHILKSMGHRLK